MNYNLKKDGSVALKNTNFSQEVSMKELITMMVMHEYPLAILDHVDIKRFAHTLNLDSKLMSQNSLKINIMKIYINDRGTFKKLFEDDGARIVIATDI